MSEVLQMKKSDLLTSLETTEDEILIAANLKRANAARILDGELFEILRDINIISFLLQELQEDYFFKFDVLNEDDHKDILEGYNKNSTYTEIISDNVLHIEKIIKEIQEV